MPRLGHRPVRHTPLNEAVHEVETVNANAHMSEYLRNHLDGDAFLQRQRCERVPEVVQAYARQVRRSHDLVEPAREHRRGGDVAGLRGPIAERRRGPGGGNRGRRSNRRRCRQGRRPSHGQDSQGCARRTPSRRASRGLLHRPERPRRRAQEHRRLVRHFRGVSQSDGALSGRRPGRALGEYRSDPVDFASLCDASRHLKTRSLFTPADTSGGALSDAPYVGLLTGELVPPPKLRDLVAHIPVTSDQIEYV
jgi:uncharacterized C2H2 Zn-finger protein